VIPRIIHRTLPAVPRDDVAPIWEQVVANTPGWERRTYQSPRDAADWPMTGHLFPLCPDRAMESNLVRFEALWDRGGVYVDSDVSLTRPLDPLLGHTFFAGWECDEYVGTAVVGATPRHPAVRAALDAMMAHVQSCGVRSTCPAVLTPVWRNRDDVTLLPAKTLYPIPYGSKDTGADWSDDPDVFAVHHWHGSWM
jgi:mannosyltransferase OCH1-like enzyme